MDLVVAGTEAAVLMVESEAAAAERRNHARRRGVRPRAGQHRDQRDPRAGARRRQAGVGLAAAGRRTKPSSPRSTALAEEKLRAAYQIRTKQARTQATREANASVMAALQGRRRAFDAVKVDDLLFDIEAKIVRSQILSGEPRIDGRDTRTVRPIEIRNGVLPRTHGSALFTRGETQALVVGDARHRARRAAHRRAGRRVRRALHAPLQHAALRHRRNRPRRLARSAARSATAASPSARSSRCCRPRTSSRTRCAWSPRSPSRTARRRWPRSAAAAWR